MVFKEAFENAHKAGSVRELSGIIFNVLVRSFIISHFDAWEENLNGISENV